MVWGLDLPRCAAADGGLALIRVVWCGSDPGSGCAAVEKASLLERVRFEPAPAGRWSSPSIERQLLFFFPPSNFKGVLFLSCVCVLSRVQLITPWTVALQALSMGISGQEYWSGLPFTPLGDLPDLGIEPVSPGLKTDSLQLSHLGRSFVPAAVYQLLSGIQRFATPCTAARQASLSFSISQSLLKFMSVESVMPFNHLVLCCPLLLPSIFPSIRVFSSESSLHIRWP